MRFMDWSSDVCSSDLALIHHLAGFVSGAVGERSVLAALAWAQYLESHAHRVYQAGAACAVDGAHALLRGLRGGRPDTEFTAREVDLKNWSPTADDGEKIRQSLALLEEYDWTRWTEFRDGAPGGRT